MNRRPQMPPRGPRKPQTRMPGNSQKKSGHWPYHWHHHDWYWDDWYWDDWYWDDWYDDWDYDYDWMEYGRRPTSKRKSRAETVLHVDAPLEYKLLEHAMKNVKSDIELRQMVDRMVSMSMSGTVLDVNNFEDIIAPMIEPTQPKE